MITRLITNSKDFQEAIDTLDLKGDTILVKPNWVGPFAGGYTDDKVIDLLLSSLKGKKVIFLESYTFWRTDKKKDGPDDYFSSKEATLETGRQHWDFFKEMDKWFLEYTGIGEVLKKHNAEYLCITDEIWEDKVADSIEIQRLVEEKYSPVRDKDLYKIVPQRLFELKGAPLISFSKAKIDSAYGLSASIKNLFGLIPDPSRYVKYHGGDEEKLLSTSIVDINKVYQSLFNTKFVVESVFEYCEMNWDAGKSTKIEGDGTLIYGDSGLEVDRQAEKVYGSNMKGPLTDLLTEYEKVFK